MTLPDIATLDTYGGAKANYAPVEDYSTDEDADDRNSYVADVAGMTHTAVRAWRRFTGHATTPADPVSNIFDNVWGSDTANKPAVTKGGTGVYVITHAATVTDELGVVHSVNLRGAWASVEGSTLYFTTAEVTSPNVITVRVYDTTFALNDAVGVTLMVCAV